MAMSSSKEVDKTDRTEFESHERLDKAWNYTKNALELLSSCFRSIKGLEDVNVALCLRNSSRCDVYSVFNGVGLGKKSKADGISKVMRRSTNRGLHVSMLYGLSTKKFRVFFTNVRRGLGLTFFNWPKPARLLFQDICDDPLPSGPGRAHSGRDKLVLMLRLCCETDEAWYNCVQREMSSLFKKEAGTGSVLQSENSNDVGQYHTFISGPIIDSESNGASEEILDDKSDVVSVGSICDAEEMSKVLELVKNLPSDSFVVSMPKRNWVSLSRLMELLMYPRSNVNCEWYIQKTPADGNCLFSAFMMAANVRGMLPLSLRSVPSLRGALKRYLKQLSSAGLEDSAFRREWLASSIHEIDNKELRLFHSNGFDRCMQSGTEADIENLLKPLRFFVSNWAEMIGDSHWGGLLRVELAILATIAGAVIEVLQKVETVGGKVDGNGQGVTVFDTRGGGSLVSCRRVDLVYPFRSKLPCTHDGFVGPIGEGMVRGGWIGPYPVLRLFLHQRHYNPCTSRYGFPIAPLLETPCNKPWSVWFNDSDTLVEPYSVLNAEEAVYYTRALTMIEDWHEASRWAPGSAGHADPLVMHSKNTELCISKLSHLQIPNEMKSTDERYMLNDEVITCYMHLLEDRANKLAQLPMREKSHAPPRCRYMDSWFYKALSRGLTGPSSRKRNKDLSSLSIIVLPALVNKHWVLAVCYMKDFVIGVYDPLQRRREEVFKVVKQWIEVHIPPPGDVEWCFKEIRESRECLQQGGVDCGVFICKAAESLGLGIPIRVSQWDIPYVRKRMMVELFRQEAISIRWPRF